MTSVGERELCEKSETDYRCNKLLLLYPCVLGLPLEAGANNETILHLTISALCVRA